MLDAHQLLLTQIAAGICLLLFAATLFNVVRMRGRMQAAQGWGKVEGIITTSMVEQPATHASDDLIDATPVIRYRYRVGGQELESDKVAVGGLSVTTKVLAAKLVGRYPVGAHVDVYVDPKNPAEALLDPGAAKSIAAVVALTIVFGLVAAILIAHAIVGHVLYANNGVPLFGFVLPIVALIGAALCVGAFIRGRQLASASLQWPKAAGTITHCDVIEEIIEDKNDDDKSIRKVHHRYQVDLRYAYKIGQRDFVGTEANWGGTTIYGLRDVAEKEAAQYHPGQNVTVYYDPQHPRNAVLDPTSRKGTVAPLIGAAICVAVGGIILTFLVAVGFN